MCFLPNKDPPETVIYTEEEAELGVENSLICFINHIYPPATEISWTKNGNPVTKGVSHSRYYPDEDQTFHQFSTLTFTPTETDFYSCTVEHSALEMPKTRTWGDYMFMCFGFHTRTHIHKKKCCCEKVNLT